MHTWQRTKIVVTLGPATDSIEMLTTLIQSGASVFRANFSHGSADDHAKRINLVRDAAKKTGQEVAIFADLQGPKIRVSRFKNKKIILKTGAKFILDADLDRDAGDEHQVSVDYKALPQDVISGDTLLLDDGLLVFKVEKVTGNRIHCLVEIGGELSNNKGINRLGGGLSAEALTDKDKEDLKTAVKLDVDYIAISFPRSAADMEYAKKLIVEAGGTQGTIAKLERAEAIPVMDEIINASDAVMVARGDLGVEIGDSELPAVQKRIIARARALNKPVITATQMMQSMVHNAIPTRAEVFDVANAVLDNTDAVMLSAETATGDHPHLVVKEMAKICLGAEKQPETKTSNHRVECYFEKKDEAIAMASVYIANHFNVKAIISLTESGSTPLWMSRIRTGTPIFAFTRHVKTERRVALYRDVYGVHFDMMKVSRPHINREAVKVLVDKGIIKKGDYVLITKGEVQEHGSTNSLKIYQVGQSD